MKLNKTSLMLGLLALAQATHARFDRNSKFGRAMAQKAVQIAQNGNAVVQGQPKVAEQYTARVVSAKTADLMQGVEHHAAHHAKPQASAQRALTRTPGVPAIDQSFLADDYDQTGQYGPSADGSAGSTQFLLGSKVRMRTFNKSTGLPDGVMNLSMDRFFSPILGETYTADPGCVYDPFAQRWYIICDGTAVGYNGLFLAISDNGNGTGDPITAETVWHYIVVDTQSNPGFEIYPSLALFDYTTIGFDQNYIYCAADVFDQSSFFYFSSAAYVIPKTSAVTGGAPTINAFRNLVNQDTDFGPCFKWPAINYDANPTIAFFVGTNVLDLEIGDSTQFLINTVDLTANPMTISAPISLAVNEYVDPIPVQPLGTPASHLVNPVVGFINCEAHIRNNQLFMIHNVGTDDTGASTAETTVDRNSIRYYQVDVTTPATPTLVNSGTLFDSTATQMSYMDPAWISNTSGQLVLGATQCSPTNYLDAIVAQVDSTTFAPSVVVPYTASTTSYNATEDWEFNPNARWGDHTRVSIDPNGTTFWACQQWCSNTDTWGLQVAEVTAN